MRVPHSPAPPSAHPGWDLALPPLTSVFSFPGPSMARHNPGGLCSFPYSSHPCQVSSPYHVHALTKLLLPNPFVPSKYVEGPKHPTSCSSASSYQDLPNLCIEGSWGRGVDGVRREAEDVS